MNETCLANKALRRAARMQLDRLARLEVAKASLTFAERVITGGYGTSSAADQVREGSNIMWRVLHEKRARAMQDVMTLGLLAVDDDIRREVAEAVLTWYGKEHVAIMQFLDPNGDLPGGWRSDAEEELRVEIRNGLAELLGGWSNLPEGWHPPEQFDRPLRDDDPPDPDDVSETIVAARDD